MLSGCLHFSRPSPRISFRIFFPSPQLCLFSSSLVFSWCMLKLRLPVSCLAFLTSSFSSSSSNEAVRDALSASKVLHLLARIFRFHFDCTDGSRSLSPPPPSLPPRQSSSPLPPISFSSPQSLQCLGRATSSDVPSSSSSRKDMDQSEEHGKEEEREVLFLRTSSGTRTCGRD